MYILCWFWRLHGLKLSVCQFVTFDTFDNGSLVVGALVGTVSQVDGHTSTEQSPQKQKLHMVPSLWSGSLALQSQVHGTGSNIWCTFITLRDKNHYTDAKCLQEKSVPCAQPCGLEVQRRLKVLPGRNQSMFEQSHNHTWHTQSQGSNHLAEDSSFLLDFHWDVRGGESWGHRSIWVPLAS